MKLQFLFLCFFSLLLVTVACDDDLNSIGLGTKPHSDDVTVFADTIYLGEKYTTTVKAGPVLIEPIATGFAVDETGARSSSFLLGSFYDPFYGSFKADFVTLFYPNKKLFERTITSIDTVLLRLHYHSWLGDSLTPMLANVYPAKPMAATDHFASTDIDLKQFSESTLWGNKTYTARDLSISDSLYRTLDFHTLSFDITRCIMPKSGETVAKTFLDKWLTSDSTFATIANLEKFFPGVYVTTTGGVGSLLKIFDVSLEFKYKFTYEEKDSIATSFLSARNDVKQACQYVEENKLPLDQLNLDASYVKSPAGVYSQYTLPVKEIANKIGDKKINTVRFAVSAYPKEEGRYALNAPHTMMLIRKDSLENFFQKSKNVEAPYSFKATYEANNTYNFGDISPLIRSGLKENPEKDIEVVLVPIVQQSVYYSQYEFITKTAYDISPSAVKLKTGKEFLRLDILSSDIYK